MIKIVSFSRKSWKIAQNSREEQPPDRSESQPRTLANSTNNYLGLVFLSIFLFLFLIFLLLKRKTKEIRLSIFATFLLASLLTVYTSVQITTKFLIGDEKDSKTEGISSKDEIIVSQTKKKKVRDRKPKDTTKDNPEKSKIESKSNNSDESENNSENNNVQAKKLNNGNNKKTESNREEGNISQEANTTNEGNISQEANTTNSANNVPNPSRSSLSQPTNLEQSPKPENRTTSNQNKRNSDNSTTRQRNLSSANQQTPINRGNNSRDRSNNAINQGRSSRDRSNSASVQTSLFRPILLKLGDRGSDVILLQTLLKELGYYTFNIDGDYGLSTELAVRNFQQQNNLLVDGVVGFSTCNILNAKTTNTEIKCSNR
ncbi:peptidoglycan-binding domain-containing protein [Spirulina sp. 06S082]|uniref:peptidoglycan-binding domain-containing protein n=1 Tax=Spirulina sp. 06S082 TaxID=3110248 RepID=UPI002B1F82CF|nr:peptidoglycan-binding protein [Spirulina sp. 06S082]MEA5470540.1 peptidoglycan-binding protein [Spirulina sp. 06S082]